MPSSSVAVEARSAAPREHASAHVFAPVVVALIAALGMAMQLSAFPNHDVAWILWGSREMLDGAIFGRDIIEPNPPLAWYLSEPSTWLAGVLGISVPAAFETFVGAWALVSLLAFQRLTTAQLGGSLRHLPLIVAAAFLFVLPGRDFGQREHLLLIAVLPYLALVARRCAGADVSRSAAVAIGIAAAVGLSLKPYFLAVPLLVEAAAMVRQKRWSFAFRPETLAIAAVVIAYGASVLLFDGDYLAVSVPLAQSIYWSFDRSLMQVLQPLLLPVVATGLCAWLASSRFLPLVFVAATAGFVISCLVQHKGYSYHVYPVVAGACLALAAQVAVEGSDVRRLRAEILLTLVLVSPVTATALWWLDNSPSGLRTVETRQLIGAIDENGRAQRFLVIAVHPFPAFPTALYTRAHYVSRTNSQWFLPAVVQSRMAGHPDLTAERHARDFALHDLSQQPDVVIVDTNSARHTRSVSNFDFLSFYREDPRLRAIWSTYRETGRIGSFRIFRRTGGAAL